MKIMSEVISQGQDVKAYVALGQTDSLIEVSGKFYSLTNESLVVTDASYKGHIDGYRDSSTNSSRVEVERSKLVLLCLADKKSK